MGTVRAELAFGLENRGHEPAAVARGVEEAALALGIAQLLDRPTSSCPAASFSASRSARRWRAGRRCVVLDEPTSQLDPVAGDELIGSLRRLNEDVDAAIVLAEHRLERCLGAADRVIALVAAGSCAMRRPGEFLRVGRRAAPELATPGARLLVGPRTATRAGRQSRPRSAARARAAARAEPAGSPATPAATPRPSDGPAPAAALAFDPRVARAARGAGDPSRRVADRRPRRAGGADGTQRRREVDAAAPRRRADAPHARPGRKPPAGSRCCCRTRPTTWSTRPWPRRPRDGAARGRARSGRARAAPSARPFRR